MTDLALPSCALVDEVTLELSERREDTKHEPAGGGRGIDVAGEHLQPDAVFLQIADEADDVGERAADPIQFPDHKSIALASNVERLGEARPLGRAARTHVVVDPLAPCATESIALKVEALLTR